jgi:hypothetical protein
VLVAQVVRRFEAQEGEQGMGEHVVVATSSAAASSNRARLRAASDLSTMTPTDALSGVSVTVHSVVLRVRTPQGRAQHGLLDGMGFVRRLGHADHGGGAAPADRVAGGASLQPAATGRRRG